MACLYCGSEIPPFRRIQDADFCSPAHRRQYHTRLRAGLHRLAEAEPQPTRTAGFIGSMAAADGARTRRPLETGMRYAAAPSSPPGASNLGLPPLLGHSFVKSWRLQPRAGAAPAWVRERAEAPPAASPPFRHRNPSSNLDLPSIPSTGGRLVHQDPLPVAPLPRAATGTPNPRPQSGGGWAAFPARIDTPGAISSIDDELRLVHQDPPTVVPLPRAARGSPNPRPQSGGGWAAFPARIEAPGLAISSIADDPVSLPPRPAAATVSAKLPSPARAPERAVARPELPVESRPAAYTARKARMPGVNAAALPRMADTEVFCRLRVQAQEFASRELARVSEFPLFEAPRAVGPAAVALPQISRVGRPGAVSCLGVLTDPGPPPAPPQAAAPAYAASEALVPPGSTVLPCLPTEIGPVRKPAAAACGRYPAPIELAREKVSFAAEAIRPAPPPPALPPVPGDVPVPALGVAGRPVRLPVLWQDVPAEYAPRGAFPPQTPQPHVPAFDIPAVLESLDRAAPSPPERDTPLLRLFATPLDQAARKRRLHRLAQRGLAVAASLLAAVAFWSSGVPMNAGRMLANMDWIAESLAARASVEHVENFRSGMKDWAGASENWANSWSRHPDGYILTGQFALYRPSQALSDYRLQMLTQIERAGLACAVRARDPRNYYAVKLKVVKAGPRPLVSLVRYPVVNGRKGKPVEVPVRATFQRDVPYQMAVEVHGRTFAASIEGQQVDRWTDDVLPSGGIGVFSDEGERARLYWVKVTGNDDLLGRICALLAGKDGSQQAWDRRRSAPIPALVLFAGSYGLGSRNGE